MVAFWVLALVTAVLRLGQYITRPRVHTESSKPKGLGDFSMTTAVEGRPIPVIFGRVRIDGSNILWYGDLTWDEWNNRKGELQGYHYHLGIQFGLCRGPVDALVNIWVGKKLLWTGEHQIGDADIFINKPQFFHGETEGSDQRGGLYGLLGFYFGTSGQTADSYLAARQNPSTNYKGTCYAVWRDTDDGVTIKNRGGFVGNDSQMDEWQWELERYPNGLLVSGDKHRIVDGANPACVLYELLTSNEYGIGEPRTRIDVASFRAAADLFFLEGNSFRYLWDSESTIETVKQYIEQQTDSLCVFNHATGLWEIISFRLDYDPLTVPVLDNTMILRTEDNSSPLWEETFNFVYAEYSEPSKGYEQSFAIAQDSANQAITGRVTPTTISLPGCKVASLANALAWRALRQGSFPGRTFNFVCNRLSYGLAFGDVRRITYKNFNFLARIVSVDYGNIENDEVRITVVREVYRNEPGTFAAPNPTYWQDPSAELTLLTSADQVAIEAPATLSWRFGQADLWPQIMTMARKQFTGNESAVYYNVVGRYGATSGGEEATFSVVEQMLRGFASVYTLKTALPGYTSALPVEATSTVDVDMLSGGTLPVVDYTINASDANLNCMGLIIIEPGTANEEWVIASRAHGTGPGGYMRFENCIRGALDSAIKAHSIGARVWVLYDYGPTEYFKGCGLIADPAFRGAGPHYYKLKFQPAGSNAEIPLIDITEIPELVLPATPRYLLPTLPRELKINTVRYPSTVNSHYTISPGVEGFVFEWTRTQWRTPRPVAHAYGRDTDGVTIFSNVLTDQLRYYIKLYDLVAHPTPGPSDHFLSTPTGADSGNNRIVFTRATIATLAGGSVPARIRIEIQALHSPAEWTGYTNLYSKDKITFDFDVT